MIERVIENWLTNTNERGFELPFCQCLISKGYTILGISFHGPVEQGKDIITLDETGYPCAFQLKSGDISETIWRQIKGEVDALVEIPIKHPKVNPTLIHRSVLVTNGQINDVVKTNITDRNMRYKQLKLSQLETIAGHELLKIFIDNSGSFLPRKITDFKVFLDLLSQDGRSPLNKKLFPSFLGSILFEGKDTPPELKRKIASGVLLTQYSLGTYENQKNHLAMIEASTILSSYIYRLVEKYKLSEENWLPSINLVIEKINFELDSLKQEFLSNENHTEAWDCSLIYKSRISIVLGWLAAFELFQAFNNTSYKVDQRIYDSIKKAYGEQTWFWGESATPLFIMMSKLCEKIGDKALSIKILTDLIIDITNKNSNRTQDSLPDPYYSPQEVIAHFYGPSSAKIDLKSFSGRSYHLSTLVDFLVRRQKRSLLDYLWKEISYILNTELQLNYPFDAYNWVCKEGKQIDYFYKNPQSWKALVDLAINDNTNTSPQLLRKNTLSYYFLLCYPHRLNRSTAKLIDLIL